MYDLAGGGFGGPIRKDRTFFWVTSEDYHDVSSPTASHDVSDGGERLGDFSALTNAKRCPGHDLRPDDASAVPGQHHSGFAYQSCRPPSRDYFPLPQSNVDNGSP